MSVTDGNIGISGDWAVGDNNWGPDNNRTLEIIRALLYGEAKKVLADSAGSHAAWDMVIVADAGTANNFIGHENELAIALSATDNWYFVTPPVGFSVRKEDTKTYVMWDGSTWRELGTQARRTVDNGSAANFDVSSAADFTVLLTGNLPYAFTNTTTIGAGNSMKVRILFVQDATGGHTLSHPASVKTPESGAVQPSGTANSTTIIDFYTQNGGSSWYPVLVESYA